MVIDLDVGHVFATRKGPNFLHRNTLEIMLVMSSLATT